MRKGEVPPWNGHQTKGSKNDLMNSGGLESFHEQNRTEQNKFYFKRVHST